MGLALGQGHVGGVLRVAHEQGPRGTGARVANWGTQAEVGAAAVVSTASVFGDVVSLGRIKII